MEAEVYSQSTWIAARAAQLYYVENSPQSEIARELGISGPTVSRLLQRARSEGLIRFAIPEPFASCLSLERELVRQGNLSRALVIPSDPNADPGVTKRAVALEGARLVQRITTPADTLGVAWGGTMYHLIQYLNPCRKVRASFVTMHGSISSGGPDLDAKTLVGRMAMAFGGRRYAIECDGLQDDAEKVSALNDDQEVDRVQSLYDKITVSISGVGSMYPTLDSRLVRSGYLTRSAITELVDAGAYGDLMLRFFDANGAECRSSLAERTIAIGFDQYRRIPRKIIAASGTQKAQSVAALVRGRLVDLLVVDEWLAREMVKLG
jgi:deoxyribonucleoside regulator